MKHARTLFAGYSLRILVVQIAALALLGLPSLAPHRDALSQTLGLTPDTFWIIVAAIVVATTIPSLRHLRKTIGRALEDIASQCSSGNVQAIHRDYICAEEKLTREFLLQSQTKLQNAEKRAAAAEKELYVASQEQRRATEKRDEAEDLLAEYTRIRQELSIDNAALRAEREQLLQSLDSQRRASVGLEVQKRTEEITAHMEKVVSSAAVKSIWLPSLAAELRTPAAIVEGLSSRLLDQWDHHSLSRIHESIEEIHTQSTRQLDRLNEVFPVLAHHLLPEPPKAPETPPAIGIGHALHQLFETQDPQHLRVAISLREHTRELPAHPPALAFVKELFLLVRDQVDSGKLAISVEALQNLQPRFHIAIHGGADPEAISTLANRHQIPLELSEQGDTDITLRFPTAPEPPADQRHHA